MKSQNLSDLTCSSLKQQKSSQISKIIEPLPGPCRMEWKKKTEQDIGIKQKSNSSHRALRNVSLTNNKSFPISNNTSRVHEYHRKISVGKKENTQGTEHVVVDRYGRPMTVQAETIKVLNQLPDLSFLNARTLLFNREQRQIVPDLGAMINRKMPGWVTSVWMQVWKGKRERKLPREPIASWMFLNDPYNQNVLLLPFKPVFRPTFNPTLALPRQERIMRRHVWKTLSYINLFACGTE